MSEIYNMKESSVIDEEMLEKAIKEQGPKEPAGCTVEEEVVNYNIVTHLRLDYRNILKIENLWQFTSLTKLQLDNNIIEKIQGLETLTNLLWLDLSFNNIEVIEGLDTLVKLQDLSLFSNRISVIENMNALQNLQIVSIGNNLITELENVPYIRKLKNLRTLDLAGNPICSDDNYKFYVAAHLPDLVYLDYRLLDEKTRADAHSQYQSSVEKMRISDTQEQKVAEVQKKMEQDLQLHKDAFVEYLNGPHLFDSMFVDDVEASKLAHLSGVAPLLESYQTELEALCVQIFKAGLTQHTQRQNEIECFFTCFQNGIADNQQRGGQIVTDFERSRRQMMAEMQQAGDHNLLTAKLKDEVMQIQDTLLTLEIQLVSQLEDVVKDFERNITDMVGSFVEFVQGIFAQCRDLENNHHENVLEIAVATLEKVAKNELEESLPDDVQLLFVDKDMMTNAVSASHDIHLLKIDNREDELLTRIKSWKSGLIKKIQDDEVQRNRKRISEINTYVDYAMRQLEETRLDDCQKTNENQDDQNSNQLTMKQ